jgi:hypothetical protein
MPGRWFAGNGDSELLEAAQVYDQGMKDSAGEGQ